MPRKKRLKINGSYHIVCRGVERRNVFLDADDFDIFLNLLNEVTIKYGITVHSFCLMTNHYHILVEINEQSNLSESMRILNSTYAMYFNKKYKRTGHLWQGRYGSFLIYNSAHFWYVTKYIERNPIKAGIVTKIEYYKYQSFYQWKYNQSYIHLIANSNIKQMSLAEYEEFINSDLSDEEVINIYNIPKLIIKDSQVQKLELSLGYFLENKEQLRNQNIKKAFDYGYKISAISKYLNLSHTAISKIINQY